MATDKRKLHRVRIRKNKDGKMAVYYIMAKSPIQAADQKRSQGRIISVLPI